MRHCKATRDICCVWTTEAPKLLALLYWLARRDHVSEHDDADGTSSNTLLALLLKQVTPSDRSDKSEQLAAALVLFELVEMHRKHALGADLSAQTSSSLSLLAETAPAFIHALVQVARQGSVVAAESKLKLTKLGLVALEALVAVLCDYASWLLVMLQSPEHSALVDRVAPIETLLHGINVVVTTLQQFHAAHAARKQTLLLALDQLQLYRRTCCTLMATLCERGTSSESMAEHFAASVERLCWHWNTSAMLLCTRSAATTRVRTLKPLQAMRLALQQWPRDKNVEHLAAATRRVCILLSIGRSGFAPVLKDDSETTGQLLLALVRTLDASMRRQSAQLCAFATDVLTALLTPSNAADQHDADPAVLVEPDDTKQALFALLFRLLRRGVASFGVQSRSLLALEQLIAAFAVKNSLTLAPVFVEYMQSQDTDTVQVRAQVGGSCSCGSAVTF